jgi:hypothetical protein
MDFLYTSILGAIFAILAIAYIYFRTSYSREVIYKEKFIEYKYRQYKYVFIAFIIFLALTYFVFKIEDSNTSAKKNIQYMTDLKCLLERIKDFYNNSENKVAISSFNGILSAMKDAGKITENEIKNLDKFYYIDSNVYKPVKTLLENNKFELLLNYLEEIVKGYDSNMYKSVFEAGSCSLKAFANVGQPFMAGSNLMIDMSKKSNIPKVYNYVQ